VRSKLYDTIILGGGVIGCSIAFNLAKKGQRILLLEKGRVASQASSAAAGMLGVQTEMEENGPLFELARKSRAMFPEIVAELREITGIDSSLIRKGMLKLALQEEQIDECQSILEWQHSKGEKAVWLEKEELLQKEPCLSEKILAALYFPNEGHVSAPDLSNAFAKAASYFGTKIREYTEVRSLIKDSGAVTGVTTNGGDFYGDAIVVATGAWSGGLLSEDINQSTVYPVKGEALSVKAEIPLLTRTLFSKGCYIVPKKGGEMIIGATSRAHTFDQKVTVEGISYLMERAKELMPVLAGAEISSMWAGTRPMTNDGLPFLGQHPELQHLFVATGHYRNGILLSPITGKIVADLIADAVHPEIDLTPFSPTRHRNGQEVMLR
jgi:glycine oxidase